MPGPGPGGPISVEVFLHSDGGATAVASNERLIEAGVVGELSDAI